MKRALVGILVAGSAQAAPLYQSRVTGPDGEAQRLRDSADAVTVHDTSEAQRQSADLGTVLNRIEGVAVTRAGGLGSDARLSLNGFANDQVRVFLDGVPLEVAGFAFGLTSLPVTMIERVEVYRGVVPLRFGADALGGALHVVSPQRSYGTGASGALQLGSFSTYRGAVSAHHRDAHTGLYGAVSAYVDSTKNDYDVAVEVPDDKGRPHEVTVPRFHDAYDARGLVVDLGVVDRPFARRLVLRGYYSEYDKELQHNTLMTVPYGAVRYGERVGGATLGFTQPLGGGTELDLVAAYAHRVTHFRDVSTDVYDWFGQVIHQRPQGGEIDGSPHDVRYTRDSVYGRLGLAWQLRDGHSLRLVSTTAFDSSNAASLTGLLPNAPDPLAGPRLLLKIVSGLEHRFQRGRIENIVFAKHYYLHAAAAELRSGVSLVPVELDEQTGGAGDSLRLRLYRRVLSARLSYEYATRMPNAQEIFGDGILVVPSPHLVPERSHNANLGLVLDLRHARAGAFAGEVNAFLRYASDLIQRLATANSFSYRNVQGARSVGVEGALRWTSPREWIVLQTSFTYQDVRNTSTEGPYGDYAGDRIPNLPWLFVHASARAQYRGAWMRDDEIAFTWFTRYVHSFYRDWESLGAPQYKQVVDTQVWQALSLGYTMRRPFAVSLAVDVENLTDARVYDVYGVQRPGRAYYGKATIGF